MAVLFFVALLISMSTGFALPPSIHKVDFKNASYPWGRRHQAVPSTWKWLPTFPPESISLENGRRDFSHGGYLLLEGITYGDLNGDRRDEAVVDLVYGTGGSASWHFLYVYALESDRPKLIAIMECGSRADGGLFVMKIKKGLLVLDFEDSELRQGDCCSEGFIRVQYRWQGDRFVETGVRQGENRAEAIARAEARFSSSPSCRKADPSFHTSGSEQ